MNMNVCFVKSGVPINMQANDNMIFAELAWKYFGKVGIDQQNDQPKFIFNSKEIKVESAKNLKELEIRNGSRIEVVLKKDIIGAK